MSRPQWITKAGNIGTIQELVYFDKTLEVTDPAGGGINYKFLAGELPPGIQVIKEGKLQGVPVILDSIEVDESRLYTFTVRATDANGVVTDRSFSINITNVFPPTIVPRTSYLGDFLDGSYFEQQLRAIEDNPNANLVWSITNGSLPPGVTLSPDGKLSGYLLLQPASYDDGLKGYDSAGIVEGSEYKQSYDDFPYDYAGRSRNKKYSFDVRVTDGSNFDTLRYELGVISKGLLTVDQGAISHNDYAPEKIAVTVDNTYITVDSDNRYVPIITTPSQSLPTIRQDNNFAFKFEAIDFEGDTIGWDLRLASGTTFDDIGLSPFWAPDTITNASGQTEVVRYEYGYGAVTKLRYPSDGSTTTFEVDTSVYPSSFTIEFGNVYIRQPDVIVGTTTYSNVVAYTEGVDYTFNNNILEFFNTPVGGTLNIETTITPPSNSTGAGSEGFDSGLFDESESRLPPDLSIDGNGWLHGPVLEQPEAEKTYNFIVSAYKTATNPRTQLVEEYRSKAVGFSLTVLGSATDQITWITPSDLGYVVNGSISELQVQATSALNQDIVYSLLENSTMKLPQGLKLLNNGLISGRSTFRYFGLDNGTTTFDKSKTVFDNLFQFTVKAETVVSAKDSFPASPRIGAYSIRTDYTPARLYRYDGISWELMAGVSVRNDLLFPASPNQNDYTIQIFNDAYRLFQYVNDSWVPITTSSTRTFTVKVNARNRIPYENLYFKAFPSQDQREIFDQIINNEEIFPSNLIYRSEDPWFGKATDIKFLEMAGLTPSTLAEYVDAIQDNHYWKRINFGEVKTAIATDDYYNTKYEVVYIEVVDPLNPQNDNVKEYVYLDHRPYVEYNLSTTNNLTDTINYGVAKPNSFDNMDDRLVNSIGYSARGMLPDWMTSVQPDKTVVGFKRAIVLAYTVPGASKLIAYRLKNNGITFNQIDFTIDRYQIDNVLTSNFDTVNSVFKESNETTFDHLILGPGANDGGIVNYASVRSFDSIHNRSVAYINANGGIDGIKNFRDGETMIFAVQEKFIDKPELFDGWVDYQVKFGTEYDPSELSGVVDDQTGFDSYKIVPGYYERLQTVSQVFLVKNATIGDNFVVIPYVIGADYSGKAITAYSGFADSCYVTSQEVYIETVNEVDRYYTKLNISSPITLGQIPGTPLTLRSSVISATGGSGNTIILDTIPVDFAVGMILTGAGIPDDTIVTQISDTTITTSQSLDNVSADTLISYFVPNKRAGVWKININDGIVTLEFINEVQVGQKVKVLEGNSYGFTFLTYDPILKQDASVPSYSVWSDVVKTTADATTFDGNGTRFFDYRDTYTEPEIGDKYIKFPQIGVFT